MGERRIERRCGGSLRAAARIVKRGMGRRRIGMRRCLDKLRDRRRATGAATAAAIAPADVAGASAAAGRGRAPVDDQYVTTAPSDQNALDIFKGEWSSQLPGPF